MLASSVVLRLLSVVVCVVVWSVVARLVFCRLGWLSGCGGVVVWFVDGLVGYLVMVVCSVVAWLEWSRWMGVSVVCSDGFWWIEVLIVLRSCCSVVSAVESSAGGCGWVFE